MKLGQSIDFIDVLVHVFFSILSLFSLIYKRVRLFQIFGFFKDAMFDIAYDLNSLLYRRKSEERNEVKITPNVLNPQTARKNKRLSLRDGGSSGESGNRKEACAYCTVRLPGHS